MGLQTIGCPETALAIRLCGQEPDGADGRGNGRALLDVLERLPLGTCRISFRIASPIGSQQLDCGWVIEDVSLAQAHDVAELIAGATMAVSPGVSCELFDLSRTAMAVKPRPQSASRIRPSKTRTNTVVTSGALSPLVAYLCRLDVGGIMTAAFVMSFGRPLLDVVCVSDHNRTDLMAALASLEISAASQPTSGLEIDSADGVAATRLLEVATVQAVNDKQLLGAGAFADLYSVVRRSSTATRIYGHRHRPSPFPVTPGPNDFADQVIEIDWDLP